MSVKHNFTNIFDCTEFKGEYEEFERGQNGRVKLDKNLSPKQFNNPVTKGRVNNTFAHEHYLLSNSSPADSMASFLPFKEKKIVKKKEITKIQSV